MKTFGILAILFVAAVSAVGYYLLGPMGAEGKALEMIIEPGMSVGRVASLLKSKRVVRSAPALVIWSKLRGYDKQMQAGRHAFTENEGVLSAAPKLGYAESIDSVITIPEGRTIGQTARIVSPVFSFDTTEFIQLCHDTVFIRSLEITSSTLEGYLFPDTYRFDPKSSAKDVIRRMVMHARRAFESLPQTEMNQKYSLHEILTIASIVEKEAVLAKERPHIAGVFHNRLRLGMPLGADPTVRYFLQKFDGPLLVSELKNPSPYNTRIHTGLPPGPICSPGLASIKATMSPLDTKDLFFVARWDGSGAHDFSRTNAEHVRKKLEIRRRNEMRKRLLERKGK
ncbi:MAG: endolytic transglycosylase MltG [Chitinispirillaceae bacterium]